jgi:hypothetical protein
MDKFIHQCNQEHGFEEQVPAQEDPDKDRFDPSGYHEIGKQDGGHQHGDDNGQAVGSFHPLRSSEIDHHTHAART